MEVILNDPVGSWGAEPYLLCCEVAPKSAEVWVPYPYHPASGNWLHSWCGRFSGPLCPEEVPEVEVEEPVAVPTQLQEKSSWL